MCSIQHQNPNSEIKVSKSPSGMISICMKIIRLWTTHARNFKWKTKISWCLRKVFIYVIKKCNSEKWSEFLDKLSILHITFQCLGRWYLKNHLNTKNCLRNSEIHSSHSLKILKAGKSRFYYNRYEDKYFWKKGNIKMPSIKCIKIIGNLKYGS